MSRGCFAVWGDAEAGCGSRPLGGNVGNVGRWEWGDGEMGRHPSRQSKTSKGLVHSIEVQGLHAISTICERFTKVASVVFPPSLAELLFAPVR